MRLARAALALAACTGDNTENFTRQGKIVVEQATIGGTSFATAGAVFTGGLVWGEAVASDGRCTLYSPGAADTFSAGQIDITGAGEQIVLVPSGVAPSVFYEPNAPPSFPAFASGATLSASAAGSTLPNDLPSFELAASAPPPVTGLSTPAMLSRNGTTVTWDAGNNSQNWVIVDIEADVMATVLQLVCDATDSGTFTLPASTLALVPKPASIAFVVVSHVRVASRIVSDTRVELDLVATSGSMQLAIGP